MTAESTVRVAAPEPDAPRAATTSAWDREERRSIARGMRLGLAIWLAIFGLDLFMALVAYPGAPLWIFVVLRLVAAVAIAAVAALAGRPTPSIGVVRAAYLATMLMVAVFVSVMAIFLGGLSSPYAHGMSLAILFVTATSPGPAGASLVRALPLALAFPATMAVASLFVPSIAASFADRRVLIGFVANYAFVVASVAVSVLVGEAVHAARKQLMEARRLGRYRLEAPIGRGGSGDVWLAWDPSLTRNVALKILRNAGDDARARFEREARAASALSSPHTVRVYEHGASDDGVLYLAMEWLRGLDLGRLVAERGPLPPARVVHFGVQACRSLAEAHAAGIVHRDIKPQNLFAAIVAGEHDVLKVLDFGVARVADDVTRTGAIVGTPAYMAPEIALGQRAEPRSDLYSLGATLYFLLTGAPPFPDAVPGAVLGAHIAKIPEPPSQRLGRLPNELDSVILRCLAKTPDERYVDATALAGALERCLDEQAWEEEDARRAWTPAT